MIIGPKEYISLRGLFVRAVEITTIKSGMPEKILGAGHVKMAEINNNYSEP